MIRKDSNFLIILSAPSGGGKTTILNEVLKRMDNVDYSISFTTRSPRGAEENGVHYHFVSEAEFEERIAAKDFLEYAKVFGKSWYGTSISYIKSRLALRRHVIMDIDVQGASQIAMTDIPSIKIFIIPPTMEELKKRLLLRQTDSLEDIERRLATAEKELTQIKDYDYLVVNDDLELAITEVMAIITAEENKVHRYTNPLKDFLTRGG